MLIPVALCSRGLRPLRGASLRGVSRLRLAFHVHAARLHDGRRAHGGCDLVLLPLRGHHEHLRWRRDSDGAREARRGLAWRFGKPNAISSSGREKSLGSGRELSVGAQDAIEGTAGFPIDLLLLAGIWCTRRHRLQASFRTGLRSHTGGAVFQLRQADALPRPAGRRRRRCGPMLVRERYQIFSFICYSCARVCSR